MKDFLPHIEPPKYLLPLTPADRAIAEGAHEIPIPPEDPNSLFLLHHAGVRQIVYRGAFILDRLCDLPHQKAEDLPPTLLYRHVLDLGDSIATLLRFGSTSNGAILLRSLFEAAISLEFMVKDDSKREERSLCYWVCFRLKQYETYLKHDASTEEGGRFQKLLDSDPVYRAAQVPRTDYSKEREAIDEYLSNPRFKLIRKQYEDARRKKQKGEWYSLCSGAKNIRELAREIGREAEYALIYQHLSEIVHGSDIITGALRFNGEQGAAIHQIRGPVTKINTVLKYSLNLLLDNHNLIMRTFFKHDSAFISGHVRWFQAYRPYFRWSCDSDPREEPSKLTD